MQARFFYNHSILITKDYNLNTLQVINFSLYYTLIKYNF